MSTTIFNTQALHGLTDEHVEALGLSIASVRCTHNTKIAFLRMREAALKDNIELDVVSGFRDFSRQNLIYSGKLLGKRVVLDKNENPIKDFLSSLSDLEKVKTVLYFSAVPGFSRHHYGTDLDVFAPNLLAPNEEIDLTNKVYGSGSQAKLSAWLDGNMQKFGFFRPFKKDGAIASELWHISYAQEADIFTQMITKSEIHDFITKHDLMFGEILKDLLVSEFEERLNLLSSR